MRWQGEGEWSYGLGFDFAGFRVETLQGLGFEFAGLRVLVVRVQVIPAHPCSALAVMSWRSLLIKLSRNGVFELWSV
jgi:hypothetical protein